MISPSMGEWRQLENWGRPLGGADFRSLRRRGQSPLRYEYSLEHQFLIINIIALLLRFNQGRYTLTHSSK